MNELSKRGLIFQGWRPGVRTRQAPPMVLPDAQPLLRLIFPLNKLSTIISRPSIGYRRRPLTAYRLISYLTFHYDSYFPYYDTYMSDRISENLTVKISLQRADTTIYTPVTIFAWRFLPYLSAYVYIYILNRIQRSLTSPQESNSHLHPRDRHVASLEECNIAKGSRRGCTTLFLISNWIVNM